MVVGVWKCSLLCVCGNGKGVSLSCLDQSSFRCPMNKNWHPALWWQFQHPEVRSVVVAVAVVRIVSAYLKCISPLHFPHPDFMEVLVLFVRDVLEFAL